jgi:hypothetical protein
LEQKVPLVIYQDGKRVVIGESLVNSDGYAISEIYDKDVARVILGDSVTHMSFGFNDATFVEMSCQCYERKGITYRQKCLLHKGVQDGRR